MAFCPSEIHDPEDVFNLVQEIGFLPFFENRISGFSIEEMTPASLWFTDVPGPWEWKGGIIRRGCAYGKFFRGKAGFISREWYTDFANYRREPEESFQRMLEHFRALFPQAPESELRKMLG